MPEIYEPPNGGFWLIDDYRKTGTTAQKGHFQVAITKGINKDKVGNDVNIQTINDALAFYKNNIDYLGAKMVKLDVNAGWQKPTTSEAQVEP